MGFVPFSHTTSMPPGNHPYASSISSSASSSSSSVFSTDGASSQASASSTNSLQILWETDSVDTYTCVDSSLPAHDPAAGGVPKALRRCQGKDFRVAPDTITDDCRSKPDSTLLGGAVPPEQRRHPRRNSRSGLDCESTTGCQHQVPSLPRQSARKVNFVDSLVDSAAQIVEVIWPLSVIACRNDSSLGGKGVLPLRTFIQETLRRSRTSYSTLQVALYYLIVLRPHVPNHDFTMEQPEDGQALRALQCGRRMFLAALILASKYLQDRNYSARAWSKISGLNTQEINLNEMTFLSAVNWRLHISETVFQRWTDIVLKYTPSVPPPSSPNSSPFRVDENKPDWSSVIPILTPDLDTVELGDSSRSRGRSIKPDASSPKSVAGNGVYGPRTVANDSTPACMYNIPRVLEPQPIAFHALLQPLPEMSRISTLPTPQLSPPTTEFNTPAAGIGSFCPSVRRPSIRAAMAQAQSICTARTTIDRWTSLPPMQNVTPALTVNSPSNQPRQQYSGYRRSSLARTSSSSSSPESMVSDTSSRSSRSSSISSVASSICAPIQARLAIQATCRSAKLRGREDVVRHFAPMSSAEDLTYLGPIDFTSSPESYTSNPGSTPDLSNFSLNTPRQNPMPCRRRDAAIEAARSLRDTYIHRQRTPQLACNSPTNKSRKRSRCSEDLSSALQQQVRSLIACSRDQTERPDFPHTAASGAFLPTPVYQTEVEAKRAQSPTRLSPRRLPLQKEMGRKRACCGEEAAMGGRNVTGPGMWTGIL